MNQLNNIQAVKILSSFHTEIKPLTYQQRENLFKSKMDSDVDLVLNAYDVFEKSASSDITDYAGDNSIGKDITPLSGEAIDTSTGPDGQQKVEGIETVKEIDDNLQEPKSSFAKGEDIIALQKSLGTAVHKYISKIGDRYVYKESEERKVTPVNELREYHNKKTSLDSVKRSLDGSPHSEYIRNSYKLYNQKAENFKNEYGHGHDSEEATHHHRMAVAGMMNHINNRVNQNDENSMNKIHSDLNDHVVHEPELVEKSVADDDTGPSSDASEEVM